MSAVPGLQHHIDEAVKAAIEAAMHNDGWTGDCSSGFDKAFGGMGRQNYHAPPPGDAAAGQDVFRGLGEPFIPERDVYSPWRTALNDAFVDWKDLPEAGDFDGSLSSIRDATSQICASPASTPGSPSSGGGDADLTARLTTIEMDLGRMQGQTIRAFNLNYGFRIRPVLNRLTQCAVALEMTYLAEQRLWAEARKSVLSIASAAPAAFKGSESTHDATTALTVAGIVGTVAATVLTGGSGAVVAGVASSAISVIKDLQSLEKLPPAKPQLAGSDPNATLENIRGALRTLSNHLNAEESALARTMDSIRGCLALDKDFDLARPEGLFHETDPTKILTHQDELAVNPNTMRETGGQHLPWIASRLRQAAQKFEGAVSTEDFNRAGEVGRFYSGPSLETDRVVTELTDTLLETGRELVDVGEILVITARAFTETDGAVSTAMREHQKNIDPVTPSSTPAPGPGREPEDYRRSNHTSMTA